MKTIKLVIPAVLLTAGLLFNTSASFAKPEYTKKEKKGCAVCHVTAKSKDLNEVGKCYHEKKTLEGCPVK